MIKQPENSKLCGQCCLATILNISLEDSIKLVGHSKSTKTKELIVHINSKTNKRGLPTRYSLCIARPINVKTNNWHWVLYKDNKVYDPIIGDWIKLEEFLKISQLKITSHFEIKI